ncbi:hypothetical protein PSHT_14114 [Puccinia striiformis]|uniref:Uncharacterized protein n=2 Tax=Puccinia striiformis TaxID=27350 RepID=A0A2S4V9N6_9BASI|nr:hypothetical protein PSHT_14114 [Puccinia striiformis]POW06204.1 hypothetical protein PSTT_09107 [Puccinia striiformis]
MVSVSMRARMLAAGRQQRQCAHGYGWQSATYLCGPRLLVVVPCGVNHGSPISNVAGRMTSNCFRGVSTGSHPL